jgi:hypothetical protein
MTVLNYMLLGTAGCHLCEQAEELIRTCGVDSGKITIELIDIAEHSQWQQDFATLIPVLLVPDSLQFLAWPFSRVDVLTFLNRPL